MSHSYTNLLYHLIFSTKNREPWLERSFRGDLFGQVAGVIKEKQGIVLAVNGVEDHVHILAKLRPNRSVSQVLSDVKSRTSGWVHRHVPQLPAFAWQTGYGAFTVSQSQVERVRQYIKDQEAHHRKMPFKDELRALLRTHGFELDEELLWQ
jgi:REP element-mobilizing transposase RayT